MKNTFKKYIPEQILSYRRKILNKRSESKLKRQILQQAQRHLETIKRLQGKEKIKVAFFAIHSSVWKYDYLYRLMVEHPKFDPIIVVCPVVNYGMENMLQEMDKCYNMFHLRKYNVIRSYNVDTQEYLDVKKEINPDIIFYTNPYKGLIDDRYYITNYPDTLTCYVSYNYGNSCLYDMFHNLPMHNLVWRLYAETESHQAYSQKYAYNKGENVVVTGYPGVDVFMDNSYMPCDIWKIKDTNLKRIIWAPHHTIGENEVISYSCFIKYATYMLDMAKKYQDNIQIAFKPHPILRAKLNLCWGEEKTTQYYDAWNDLPNGMLVDADYVDLFLTSDAMIHDSGSFITEYLYTNNPVMRTDNGIDLSKEFNSFALECLSVYYHGKNEEDIENFIRDVITGHDPLKDKRTEFFNQRLLPPNNKLASLNILDDILKSINSLV